MGQGIPVFPGSRCNISLKILENFPLAKLLKNKTKSAENMNKISRLFPFFPVYPSCCPDFLIFRKFSLHLTTLGGFRAMLTQGSLKT